MILKVWAWKKFRGVRPGSAINFLSTGVRKGQWFVDEIEEWPGELCRDLMRYDCANHPDGTQAFNTWAKGSGGCPYDGCKWQRAANFREKKDLWKPGRAQSALKLATRLIAEKCQAADTEEETERGGNFEDAQDEDV